MGIKTILTRVNIKLTRIVTISRELQFHIYGSVSDGVRGLFCDGDAKLVIPLTQHEFQDISVWFTGSLNVCRQKDFFKEVCIMFRNAGITISPRLSTK